MTLWLIGAGDMAAAYAAVLADLRLPFAVIANSANRAAVLAQRYGVDFLGGGLNAALEQAGAPRTAILATPVDTLAPLATALLTAGTRSILIEKPGALDVAELAALARRSRVAGADVRIGYNRRFLASAREARRRIDLAGGALSFLFEFNEASDRIASLSTDGTVKQRWVLANSSHVIDLAFHLCGQPAEWSARASGGDRLEWHRAASVFRGCGETAAGASFSYAADWRGPGRWRLEIVLPAERLILSPLEQLSRMARGSFTSEPVACDDELDRRFKPGLHRQLTSFLAGDAAGPPTIGDHAAFVSSVVYPIAGYANGSGHGRLEDRLAGAPSPA